MQRPPGRNGTDQRIKLDGPHRRPRVSFSDLSERVSAWKVLLGLFMLGVAGGGGVAYGLSRANDHEHRLSIVETHLEWIRDSLKSIGDRLGAKLPKE